MAFKKNYVLAIDLGTSGIRLGVFADIRGKLTVINHGEIPVTLADESDNNRENNETVIMLALEKLLRQCEINPKKVVKTIISTPGRQVGIKQISMVKLSDEELESSLIFEARKHLPVKGDEVLLDYQILKDHGETLDVLLAVAARQTIESIHRILEQCGLKPDVIDVPILAVNNAVMNSLGDSPECLIIHSGYGVTHVSLFTAAGELMTREIPTAGREFTEEIRKEKQISFEEAEALKLEKGVLESNSAAPAAAEGELTLALASTGTNSAVESLTRELQRSIRFFIKEAGVQTLETIYLSGGTCADQSFIEHIQKELRMSVTLFDPFAANGIDTDIKERERSIYTQLVGMGIRRSYAV